MINSISAQKLLPKTSKTYNKNIKVISILDSDQSENWKSLDHFAEKYKHKNVSFIAITDKLTDNNLPKDNYKYKYLSALENKKIFNTHQTGMYKVFPMYIILNKDGEIIYKKKGTSTNIEIKLARRIDKLLAIYGEDSNIDKIQYTVR